MFHAEICRLKVPFVGGEKRGEGETIRIPRGALPDQLDRDMSSIVRIKNDRRMSGRR